MAASLVHFGVDQCHRTAVLKNAGYSISSCRFESELEAVLAERPHADAVVMTGIDSEPQPAVDLVRAFSPAPLVLFHDSHTGSYNESEFDLVVEPVTSPKHWLARIAELIADSRALYARSDALREQSSLLVSESKAARNQTVIELNRLARNRRKVKL